ncbi:hypothetical protein M2168_001290 [Streptomyces sp. CZ24]|nr:hypothetical protein [Streptomyces sp. CZ24]MDH6188258.1 hypothetical protein [Streptomyces sp. CZ24]
MECCPGQELALYAPRRGYNGMFTFVVGLKDKGGPASEVAKEITIKAGKTPSLRRRLAEAGAADDGLLLHPNPACTHRPDHPLGSRHAQSVSFFSIAAPV